MEWSNDNSHHHCCCSCCSSTPLLSLHASLLRISCRCKKWLKKENDNKQKGMKPTKRRGRESFEEEKETRDSLRDCLPSIYVHWRPLNKALYKLYIIQVLQLVRLIRYQTSNVYTLLRYKEETHN